MAEGMVETKKVWMWVGIAAAVLVVVAAGVWYFSANATVTVPDVTGKSATDAVHALQAAGLTLGATSQQESTSTLPGTVLSQVPLAKTSAKKGSAVSIVVAKAQSAATVPNVASMTASAAADAVKAAGLVPVTYNDFNSSTPSGLVFGQAPAAGTAIAPGSEVAIGVSLGKAPSNPKVPNVVGMTAADAQTALKNAGFTPKEYQGYSDKVASGLVITQLPAAGTEAQAGAEVGYQVSKGKAPSQPTIVTVPNVVGKTQADASSALQNAGLGVEVTSQYSDTVAKGNVIGQVPSSGSKVEKGTVVGIAVSKGKAPSQPAMATVPNVTGQSQADATTALQNAGLKVQVAEEYSETVAKGNVMAQLPEGGSQVAPNSLVVIEVSKGPQPVVTPY